MAEESAHTDPAEAAPGRIDIEAVVEVRSAAKRELDVRVMPWGQVIESSGGTEEFARGAFDVTDPTAILLSPAEHTRQFALGHDGKPTLTFIPAGRGMAYDDRPDGAYVTFKVARTQAGDEVLALAEDGIARGASVEFTPLPGGTEVTRLNGRRHLVRRRASLDAVTTTYRPAYRDAGVVAMRTADEGEPKMAEAVEITPVPATPAVDFAPLIEELRQARGRDEEIQSKLLDRLEKLEEQARSQFVIPPSTPEPSEPTKGQWMEIAVKLLSGERIADQQMRTVADFITTDNAGVVPDAYMTELIGVIDTRRPFLNSTRRVETPASGMSIVFPKLTQRPATGVQTGGEKTELASTKTVIGTASYDAITIGGYGDLSLQLLKRSSPSFLGLYLELMAEAYGIDAEEQAVTALANAMGGWGEGNALDPEALSLGAAYAASMDAMKTPPDTIWLSTEAVGAFIDAKASGTNAPLYANIAANFTAGQGPGGLISGLRPVHVPALDARDCFAIVGPSRGFAWAEDGTYTLQVDVPAKAGRDVGVVGMLWAMPIYPDAFTLWNVAS